MKPRDYPCLASAAPLDIATAEVKFRLLLKAQNRFDNSRRCSICGGRAPEPYPGNELPIPCLKCLASSGPRLIP
jgi:hypothetical protein